MKHQLIFLLGPFCIICGAVSCSVDTQTLSDGGARSDVVQADVVSNNDVYGHNDLGHGDSSLVQDDVNNSELRSTVDGTVSVDDAFVDDDANSSSDRIGVNDTFVDDDVSVGVDVYGATDAAVADVNDAVDTGSTHSIVLTEIAPVPSLCDETATFRFSSSEAGSISYNGSCGFADLLAASAGDNSVTWTFAVEGTHADCSIQVSVGTRHSNVLQVPSFKTTDKYPIVFVHGLRGQFRTAWRTAKNYMETNGWEVSLIPENSISTVNEELCVAAQAPEVAGWVDDILGQYPGFERVDMVGHSRGGSNIMRALWHGHLDQAKVRYVVTMAGANRACPDEYPPIPTDETPGAILYSVYFSDGANDCDQTDWNHTYLTGAYSQNLYPLCHADMKDAPTALAAMLQSLLGQVGSN